MSVLTKYEIPIGAIIVNRVLPSQAQGMFLRRRKEREAKYLRRIRQTFQDFPIYLVPLAEGDIVGMDELYSLSATRDGSTIRN